MTDAKLILLDLDKTLIDASYQITDNRVFDLITELQSKGWSIGLSSDTPLPALEIWSAEFGMNGPIIAERGAVVKLANGKVIEAMPEASEFFGGLRKFLREKLFQMGIPYYYGDATSFLRNKPKLTGMIDQQLTLINAYRTCSLGFFGRTIDQISGELSLNNDLVQELIEVLRSEHSKADFELVEDFSPDYSIYILSPKEINKRLGTKLLLNELGLEKCIMIGDSGTDIVGSDIAHHHAVGNALPVLKEVSEAVASESYTAGVVELFEKILATD